MSSPVTPNLNLWVPTSGDYDEIPQWGQLLNENFETLDSAVPSASNPLTPDLLNINQDVDFNGWAATHLKLTSYEDQDSALSSAFLSCLYFAGGEFFINDGAGNDVQMTNNGSVNAAAGNIGNLPSTPSGAALNWNQSELSFDFLGAGGVANPMANVRMKTLTLTADNYAPTNSVTLKVSGLLASVYDLTLPVANPVTSSTVQPAHLIASTSGLTSWSAPTSLIVPTLATGWTGSNGFGYWRDTNNCIHWQGWITAGVGATIDVVGAAGIPSQYRPTSAARSFIVPDLAALPTISTRVVNADTAGALYFSGSSPASGTAFTLDGISYGAGR